jgi:hypothetical protein
LHVTLLRGNIVLNKSVTYEDILSKLVTYSYKSVVDIAQELGCSQNAIKCALRELEVTGYVKCIEFGEQTQAWCRYEICDLSGFEIFEDDHNGVKDTKVRIGGLLFSMRENCTIYPDLAQIVDIFMGTFDITKTTVADNKLINTKACINRGNFSLDNYDVNQLVPCPYTNTGNVKIYDYLKYRDTTHVSVGKVNSYSIYLNTIIDMYNRFKGKLFTVRDVYDNCEYFNRLGAQQSVSRIRGFMFFFTHLKCVNVYEHPNKADVKVGKSKVYLFIENPIDILSKMIKDFNYNTENAVTEDIIIDTHTQHEIHEILQDEFECQDNQGAEKDIYMSLKKHDSLLMLQYIPQVISYATEKLAEDNCVSLYDLIKSIGLLNVIDEFTTKYNLSPCQTDELIQLVVQRSYNVIKSNINHTTMLHGVVTSSDDKRKPNYYSISFKDFLQPLYKILKQFDIPLSSTTITYLLHLNIGRRSKVEKWCNHLVEVGVLMPIKSCSHVKYKTKDLDLMYSVVMPEDDHIKDVVPEELHVENKVEENQVVAEIKATNKTEDAVSLLKSSRRIPELMDDMGMVLSRGLFITYRDRMFNADNIKHYFKINGFQSHADLIPELIRFMLTEHGFIRNSGGNLLLPFYKFIKEPIE